MKKIVLFLTSFILISCASKEDKIKEIIDDSYFGVYELKKMSEIKKLKEDIFSIPVHYTIVKKYFDTNKKSEYEIVRYIYKTFDGVYRIFYLIDLTNKKVVYKSSDYNNFFKPLVTEMTGENVSDLEGNNLIELMRY